MIAVATTLRIALVSDWESHLDNEVEEFVDEIGDEVLANAKRLAPTDTTALQGSLIVERDGGGRKRVNRVGVDPGFTYRGRRPADYADYVENGTSIAPAQPFLRPALYQVRGR